MIVPSITPWLTRCINVLLGNFSKQFLDMIVSHCSGAGPKSIICGSVAITSGELGVGIGFGAELVSSERWVFAGIWEVVCCNSVEETASAPGVTCGWPYVAFGGAVDESDDSVPPRISFRKSSTALSLSAMVEFVF